MWRERHASKHLEHYGPPAKKTGEALVMQA